MSQEARVKEVRNMEKDCTNIYGYLWSKLSKESEDEICRDPDYDKVDKARDPLELWKIIIKTHMTSTSSKVVSVVKKTARDEYQKCTQGEFMSIVDYKRLFDTRLQA
jgi:hypothetical protein